MESFFLLCTYYCIKVKKIIQVSSSCAYVYSLLKLHWVYWAAREQ